MITPKAAAFDLDDTLLHNDLSISAYTKEVFHDLSNNGFILIPSSGRSQMSMKPFLNQIATVPIYISCNGAEIWDGNDQLLYRETFSVQQAHEIVAFGREYNCYAQAYGNDRFYYNQKSVFSDRYAATSMLSGEYVGDLESFIDEPQTKILMMAEEKKISVMLLEAQKRFKGKISVTSSKPYFLEFNSLLATKGIALSKVSKALSIHLHDIIAFGDSLNDLSMLKAAGYSVAVSNARLSVISQCDSICLSNEEDGVAHFLSEQVLHKGGSD